MEEERKPIWEKPELEVFPRDVVVWDTVLLKWLEAHRTDVLIHTPLSRITWTNTGVATDVTPDTDQEIDVEFAQRIAIQVNTTHASHTSTDTDVNVEASLDGSTWDTIPYAERNIGDNQIKTFLVEVSVKKIRLRLNNNAAATTAYVTALIMVVK